MVQTAFGPLDHLIPGVKALFLCTPALVMQIIAGGVVDASSTRKQPHPSLVPAASFEFRSLVVGAR